MREFHDHQHLQPELPIPRLHQRDELLDPADCVGVVGKCFFFCYIIIGLAIFATV